MKTEMQIIIARLMWIVLPFFGRALSITLLQNNVGIVSAFLANVSLSGLAYIIWNTRSGTGGMTGTMLGRDLMSFLAQRGITGPFASVYGYWMVVAAFLGKVVWISLLIGLSPVLGAFLYWMVKSLRWSVYYLQEIYNNLPGFVKNYFVYVNSEIMHLYQGWFSPVVEQTKTYSK